MVKKIVLLGVMCLGMGVVKASAMDIDNAQKAVKDAQDVADVAYKTIGTGAFKDLDIVSSSLDEITKSSPLRNFCKVAGLTKSFGSEVALKLIYVMQKLLDLSFAQYDLKQKQEKLKSLKSDATIENHDYRVVYELPKPASTSVTPGTPPKKK